MARITDGYRLLIYEPDMGFVFDDDAYIKRKNYLVMLAILHAITK
ncbi:MAG TPA: hypothetical protein VE223_08330 [Nitrososphaeraceae archaeon]|nr:hypothetical protein [Nitrososphaeraceae archaeon]